MAALDVPDELIRFLALWGLRSVQVTLNLNQGRVESYDLRLHERVLSESSSEPRVNRVRSGR